MAYAIGEHGTGTISATTAGPGGKPYLTITATGLCTATGLVQVTPRYPGSKDVDGPITLQTTKVGNDSFSVYADRQIPAGEEIVFDWCITTYTA